MIQDLEEAKQPIKAIVDGKELTKIPDDLFIPPDALEILLDSFSGPLDLLLYLIRKQNIDILDIPIVQITKQYLQYIDLMGQRRMELAAEYLLMAAMLAEIKSKLLLPTPVNEENSEEEDPRMALVRRLQAYEQMKEAAQLLDYIPREERDNFVIRIKPSHIETIKVYPNVLIEELIEAMKLVLKREEHMAHHQIEREVLSVRERMSYVLLKLQENKLIEFTELFNSAEGRMGLVVSFLAILELARQSLIIVTQTQAFSAIHLQAA